MKNKNTTKINDLNFVACLKELNTHTHTQKRLFSLLFCLFSDIAYFIFIDLGTINPSREEDKLCCCLKISGFALLAFNERLVCYVESFHAFFDFVKHSLFGWC